MRRLVSKPTATGIFCVAGYLLVTAGLVFYSVTCSGAYCGLGIILPVMPWILLLESILPDTILTYFLIVIFNSILIYLITRYVSRLVMERGHRKEMREI